MTLTARTSSSAQISGTEFPIVSSSSSTLEEPRWVSEEPKECNTKLNKAASLR